METKEQVFKTKRAGGPATILAIGTATPPNFVDQADYPDLYFRVTNSEHMTDLKKIFKQMCSNTMIKKCYGYMSEEILKQNPCLCSGTAPSLGIRQKMAVEEVPKLGMEAALKAIKEWGQPKSTITHLIFCTTTGVEMPGADLRLAKLLDLQQSINRFMFYYQGCYAGGTALRLAKDVAENNEGARVLVVCCEISSIFFHGPSEPHLGSMVGLSLFGDGAAALIVGANPKESCEKPLFELISAAQTTLPNTETAMALHLREVGHTFQLSKELPALISKNIEDVLADAFSPFGITDWNSIFWVVHPGGRAILDKIESKLGLQKQKLKASRHILSEYGNMTSASVLYILDEMRRRSIEEEKATTGEGLEWGVLLGFGAGLTIETVVLRSLPLYGQSSC